MDANRNSQAPRPGWSQLDRLYVEYLHLKGLTHSEIAPKLDRTPRAVKNFLSMLRRNPGWKPQDFRLKARAL